MVVAMVVVTVGNLKIAVIGKIDNVVIWLTRGGGCCGCCCGGLTPNSVWKFVKLLIWDKGELLLEADVYDCKENVPKL